MSIEEWSKKIPARKGYYVEVAVDEDGISLYMNIHTAWLTPNQAGDLAHALQEAIQKAQAAK